MPTVARQECVPRPAGVGGWLQEGRGGQTRFCLGDPPGMEPCLGVEPQGWGVSPRPLGPSNQTLRRAQREMLSEGQSCQNHKKLPSGALTRKALVVLTMGGVVAVKLREILASWVSQNCEQLQTSGGEAEMDC